MDDGFRAGLLSLEQLCEEKLFFEQYKVVQEKYPDLEDRRLIYEIIRRMIDTVVTDLIEQTASRLSKLKPSSIEDVRAQKTNIVGLSDGVFEKHAKLKQFLNKNLYQHEKVLSMTGGARLMIEVLFDRYMRSPHEMPDEFARRASTGKARVVADYIAGMTDRFAIAEHERLN